MGLRGSQLVLAIGNQQPGVLEPDIDGWFNLKGAEWIPRAPAGRPHREAGNKKPQRRECTLEIRLQFPISMRASFPPFLVDMGTRQLLREGQELPLPPKAFQLLALLIERRPRAISQKEIYDHLWPDSYVGAGSLHSLVHQLRSALGDHQRRIIRTAYGFGFSFAARVTEEKSLRRQPIALVVERRRFELTDGENIIGRSDDAAVVLNHWSVSRHHARLLIADDDITVEDLDSKNGTFLNGQRIESATAVRAGDEIRFGRVRASLRRQATAASTGTDSALRRRLNQEIRRK